MRRLGVPAFSVAHGSATGLSPSPPHLSLRSGVPLCGHHPLFLETFVLFHICWLLVPWLPHSAGDCPSAPRNRRGPGSSVPWGPPVLVPLPDLLGARPQPLDSGQPSLLDPPSLPLYLVFPALPILGKPV